MPTIRVNIPSRNQTIEFDEGTPESVIQEVIKRDFPRNGSDVAYEVNDDPTFSKSISNEDFELYEGFLDKKKTDFVGTAANAAGYLASTVGAGIKGLFEARNLNPEVAAATAIESGAQGTRDLYGMVAQSEDPSSIFFKFKDFINGTGTVEDRKKQWLEARDFSENTRKMEAGQQTVSGIDPSLINNDVKNALKLIADPTLFIPGVGELLGAGKLGARVTGAAMEVAGRTAQAVTRPLVDIVDASTRMAGEAFGANANAIKGLAAGSGVTGVVMGVPGVREAAMAIGTVEGVNKAGQVLATAGQALGRTPTRIGALESLALNPNASAVDRALAKVGRYGGDDLIDLGARSAAGAVEGAAIGTTLGYLSAGEEGAASGFGAGTLLGGAGAGAARLYGKASGAAAIENRHGDYKRFYESLDPETQAKFDTIVKQSGLDGASQVMDVSGLVRGKFNDADVRFSTTEEFAKKYGQDARGVQVTEGDRPVIDINVDKFSSQLTAGHELFHAFKAIDQLRPMAEKVEQMIVGNYVIDQNGKSVRTATGLLDDAAVVNRFNEYVAKLQPDASSPWSKANTLLEKSKLVGEELGAEYMTRMIAGSDTDVMLRGFDGLTRTILDHALLSNTDGFIRRTAQSIGLGSKPIESLVFSKLENASPALNAALRDMVRARRNMSEKIALADDNGYSISKKDLANPAAAKVATDMGIAEVSPDGIVRMKPDDVLAKEDRESADALANAIKAAPVIDASEPRLREVDGQVIGDGISNAQLAAIQASPSIIDKVKQAISIVKDSIDNGNVIFIRNGKATKEIRSKLTGKTLKRYNDGVRITERDVVPYSLATSKSGELYIRTFDISKARGEAMKLAGRDRLGPYGADFQTFYGDLTRYLNNLSDRENAVPTKELLGDAAKAAYMTDFFGGKDGTSAKYIRNFTLDRMVDMRLTGEKVNMSQIAYDRNKVRFMPAETIGDGKVFNSPDSGFRIISKNAGKYSLYAPTGERVGIYDTQAKAEAISNKLINQSTRISVSDPKIVDGIVTAPESGAFKFTKDIAANFMPADSKVKLDDYADRIIIALAADRMGVGPAEVGPLSNRKTLSVPTQGGREFMKIFNGGGWAFTDIKTSDRFLSRLRQFADRNGNTIVGVTVLNEINHLNNPVGQLAYVETLMAAIEGGVVSKSQADAHIKEISRRIVASKAGPKSLPQATRDLFSNINNLDSLVNAVKNREVNFKSASWLVNKAQAKTLPISYNESTAMGMSVEQIARGLTDKELLDIPSYSVVALMEVNVNQKPDLNNFHHAYPVTVHGKTIGFLDKFYNLADLSTEPKIRNESGAVTAQPVQNVMPVMDNIRNTIETKKGIPSDPAQRGDVNFMPSEIKPNRIEEIAAKVGGGKLSNGAKKFGAFMQEMKDKDITVRDVIKSYGITLSSIQRGEQAVNTVKKRWSDAPFVSGSKVRPEDAFAALLGTTDGKKYLDSAEQGKFDSQSAEKMIEKFASFGLQNKLLVSLKDAAEKFYPKAEEIISAVRSMPASEYSDYVRQNFPGISYGKVGFMSGQLGRGDLPTFDSRQKQLVYGKDVNITKERLLEQRDRLLKLGIDVPEKYKEFAQTLLHHEVWDRLNKSDTEHGEIKNAMLNFMPADSDYLAAANSGDTKSAQQMVDQAAKAAGYGTNVGGFFVQNANESIGKLPTWADEIYKFGKLASGNGRFETVKQYNRAASYGDAIEPKRNSVTESALRYWDGSDGTLANYIFEQGLKGEEIGPFVFAERIGNAPERGYSLNYRDQTGEPGVSVLGLLDPSKGLVKQNDGTFELFNDGERRFVGGFLTPFKGSDGEPLLIGIQFDGKRHQIKSADPITRDDAGNIIPLSQRFKGSNDIRFMPDAPNTPAFKEWFGKSKVVDRNSSAKMVYSGQPRKTTEFSGSDRSEFPRGVMFATSDRDIASKYAGSHIDERNKRTKFSTGRKGQTLKLYLKIENPWHLSKFDEFTWSKAILEEAGYNEKNSNSKTETLAEALGLDKQEEGGWSVNGRDANINNLEGVVRQLWRERSGQGDFLQNALDDSPSGMALVMFPDAGERIINSKKYDGFVFEDTEMGGTTYVPFESTQIKKVGNLTPDGTNPNIRFQPAMQFGAVENLPNGKVWRGENGYAIIQKESGKFRVHSPIGLIGIAASYEAAEKMANKRNTR